MRPLFAAYEVPKRHASSEEAARAAAIPMMRLQAQRAGVQLGDVSLQSEHDDSWRFVSECIQHAGEGQ